jgi:hypothetical protein
MDMKKFILPMIILLSLISGVLYMNHIYLYMPYAYQKSEIVPLTWTELKQPLVLEICHDGFEGECVYSTEKADIKFIIDSLQDVDYRTKSRGEFRDLDYSTVDLSDVGFGYYFDNQYTVVIRQLDQTKDEVELGYWVYSFDFYTFSNYVNGPGGNYYYYELPNTVREFVYQAEESFTPYHDMFGE